MDGIFAGIAYRKNVAKMNIPGFRKGKAPRAIVEKMYGKGVFYEDAINECLGEAYEAALKESKLDVVGRPEFDIESIEGDEPVMKASVYVKPDVTIEGSSVVKAFSWLYYKNNPSNEWCPFAGGFEFSEGVSEFVYGPAWRKNVSNNPTSEADYTIIKGLDGWHRIGLQYHQNVYRNGNSFSYDVTLTVYVDGVKTNEMIVNWGNFFYTAAIDGDNVVYTDNIDVESYYAVFYRIGNPHLQSGKTDAYFVFADCLLSVGDGFVLDVAPVADPEAKDFTVVEGVNLSGKMYYQLKTAE